MSKAEATGSKAGSRPRGVVRERLLEAALDLARAGGPDAVVLREVTRTVGVAPNAAYRHYADRDALVSAVAAVGLSELGRVMRDRIAALPSMNPELRAASALGEVGRAYVEFALAEPGLFRVAFASQAVPPLDGLGPYEILRDALDECARVGLIPAGKREGAEGFCWSAVHGFAELHLDGPLADSNEAERAAALQVLLDRIGGSLLEVS